MDVIHGALNIAGIGAHGVGHQQQDSIISHSPVGAPDVVASLQAYPVTVRRLAGDYRVGGTDGSVINSGRDGRRDRLDTVFTREKITPIGQVLGVGPILGILGPRKQRGEVGVIGREKGVIGADAGGPVKFRRGPQKVTGGAGGAAIAIDPCGDSGRVRRGIGSGIEADPAPGCNRGLGAGHRKSRVIGLVKAGGDGHDRRETGSGAGVLIRSAVRPDDQAGSRIVVFGHDKCGGPGGKTRAAYLGPNPSVRILHGKHPVQLETALIEDVRSAVSRLRKVEVEVFQDRLVPLVGPQEFPHRDVSVDDVFAVITGVVPALG